jgi:hypothetical protein
MEGWLDVSSGRKELSMTKEHPEQAMEMIDKSEPRGYMAGLTKMNAMAAAAPVKAKMSSSRLRLLPIIWFSTHVLLAKRCCGMAHHGPPPC